MLDSNLVELISQELALTPQQVAAVIHLFDSGATAPFIAHYRKDVTGHIEEAKLEAVAERNNYYIGVMNRRAAIKEALEKQEKLTDELRAQIDAATDKVVLEDIYLPFKNKRRTKATQAEEQGLAPLADFLMRQLPIDIEEFINTFVKPEKSVSSPEEALGGACYILAERFALDANLRQQVRKYMQQHGKITTRPTKNAENAKTKYESYYEFSESVQRIPSHRMLAILRGVKEGFLRIDVTIDDEALFNSLLTPMVQESGSVFETALKLAMQEAYTRHLRPGMENEIIESLRRIAEEEAVRVFRQNAESLLLSPAAGPVRIMGVVPIKRGCKVAVADIDGSFLEHQTVMLDAEPGSEQSPEQIFLDLMNRQNCYAIVIANSPGSGDVSRFVKQVLSKAGKADAFALSLNSGPASGYATSREGREEYEDLEPAIREAIFLARMVQDPLAELVKVEPRSIGVGQYQHDVNQKLLRDGLHKTIVSCVNRVGVDLNKASVALLRYVSGIQMGTAQNIVAAREKLGGFTNRQQLLEVDGVGPKVFELSAGFLRIPNAENVLDGTRIHPENYPLIEKMAQGANIAIDGLFGSPAVLENIDWKSFESDGAGPFTLAEIRVELLHPGRDIRKSFKAPKLVEGIASLDDLKEGMDIEGVVTNVTDFGAFVDIGMQQDGLVHLSELSKRFVKDPREIIKVGDVVKVRVIKVDRSIPRISLSMKVLQPDPKPRPRHAPRPQEGTRPASADAAAPQAAAAPQEEGDARSPERRRRRDEQPRRRPESEEAMQARRRRSDSEGDRRQRSDRDHGDDHDRKHGKGPRRDKGATPMKYGDEGSRINTLLADQLAALREKIASK